MHGAYRNQIFIDPIFHIHVEYKFLKTVISYGHAVETTSYLLTYLLHGAESFLRS